MWLDLVLVKTRARISVMPDKILELNLAQLEKSRSEDILINNIDGIELFLKIFKELPIDSKGIIDPENQYYQEDSIIVIADEKSSLGEKMSEFMIDYNDLEAARDGEDPPDVTIGIVNIQDAQFFIDSFGKTKIKLSPNVGQEVQVVVVSNESLVINLPLPK